MPLKHIGLPTRFASPSSLINREMGSIRDKMGRKDHSDA